uniref:Uncharacterized protein n=1 Tax=Romanomermis culicivorax TaxID=13658 RepID=A0A915HPR4_ROMCU
MKKVTRKKTQDRESNKEERKNNVKKSKKNQKQRRKEGLPVGTGAVKPLANVEVNVTIPTRACCICVGVGG